MRTRLLIVAAAVASCSFALSLFWSADLAQRVLGRTTVRSLAGLPMSSGGGKLWMVDVSSFGIGDRADNANRPAADRVLLLENGRPLTRSPSHDEIRRTPGLFSHWGDAIFFSSSADDGTHPSADYSVRYRDTSRVGHWILRYGSMLLPIVAGLSTALAAALLLAGRRSELASLLATCSLRFDRYSLAACGLFCALSIPLTFLARNDRSGWTLMTRPGHEHVTNSQLGYCCFRGGIPVMEENCHSDRLVGYLSGVVGGEGLTCYAYRGWYSFTCTLLAPVFGVMGAMQLVNWLGWAVAAWAAFRFATFLSEDRLAGVFAVGFVSGSMGMLTHIGDYSAHLIAGTMFYLGAYLIRSSGVLTSEQSLRVHVFLGAFLAVSALTYTNGLILIVLYALSAVRRNRWWHVGLALGIALTARSSWEFLLSRFGLTINNDEGGLMTKGLRDWLNLFADFRLGWATFQQNVIDLYGYECPSTMLAGFVAWLCLGRRGEDRWFGILILVLPTLAVLPFCLVANARGYLVYGASVWLITWAAILLARLVRGGWLSKSVGVGLAALLVGGQFAWSTAHLWGQLGPVKTYYVGFHQGWEYFRNPPTTVVSMTDAEPTPIAAGGTASLAEAGAYVTEYVNDTFGRSQRSVFDAFRRRILFFVYLSILAGAWGWWRGLSRQTAAGLAAVVMTFAPVSATASALLVRSLPAYNHFKYNGAALPPHGSTTYRVQLGPDFLRNFDAALTAGDDLRLFLWHLGDVRMEAFAGDRPLAIRSDGVFWRILDAEKTRRDLLEAREITIVIRSTSDQTLAVCGWQRHGLPGRTTSRTPASATATPAVPALELRIYRADGTEKFAGF